MTTANTEEAVQQFLAFMEANLSAKLRDMLSSFVEMQRDDDAPMTVERLATAGGWQVEEVRTELSRFSNMEIDEAGRIRWLKQHHPHMPHRFVYDGKTTYGCASDTLAAPAILGRPGVVESTCPATGRPIRIEATPTEVLSVDPPETVVSKVRPTESATDVVAEVCGVGHFFSSPEAADNWLAHNPEGFIDTVTDDFEIARQGVAALGWAAPATPQTSTPPGCGC